jgi:hypothetical protein
MKRKYYLMLLIALTACNKDLILPIGSPNKLTLVTSSISAITQTGAASSVQVTGGISADIADKGICWAISINPTISFNKLSGSGVLTMTNLTPGTIYYVRGYVVTKNETLYGGQQQFTTLAYQLATLSTVSASSITLTSALSGGNVTVAGGGTVTAKGVCWSTVSIPTIINSKTSDGSGLGSFISTLSSLSPGTVYYVRAYATNQAGTAYGAQISLTTLSILVPTLSTGSVSSITKNSAVATGSVTADGGGTVTSRGICWSTSSNPTLTSGTYFTNGTGIGTISGTITGLVTATTYYFRAFATNSAGTAYGAVISFRTL